MPVAGIHIPLVLSGDGVLTTRNSIHIVLEVVSVLLILQEILTNLWEDLREVCSQVTFGWMAKNSNPFHDVVIIRKYVYMYPLVKGINTKSYYLQVRAHSAE